jgi:hypothetical protein
LKQTRKLGACVIALIVGLAGVEFGLRAALFSDSAWIRERAWRLRRAELYFDPSSDDDYWKLRHFIEGSTGEVPAAQIHPELGWIDTSFDPVTLVNRNLPDASDPRRPVLLFGSSFSRCMAESGECFEALLARSPLRDRFVLVNCGVRGYGIDQTYLLLRATLARYAARKPIVIVGLLLDDDLDRCVLRLRGSPRPKLMLRAGELVRESERVPTLDEYLRDNPIGTTSYAWRGVMRACGSSGGAADPEKRALGAAVIAGIVEQLREAGVEFFFVLYSGEETLRTPVGASWREALALDGMRKAGARFVATRGALEEFAREHGGSSADCFLHEGESGGHYSAIGNQLAFSAMLAGLEGKFE